MFKTRTRMVSFRLSEDEYERLKDLSLTERARSVSDFARAALCKLPNGNDDSIATTAAPRMEKLEGAVSQLKQEMHQLRQMVETSIGPVRAAAASAAPLAICNFTLAISNSLDIPIPLHFALVLVQDLQLLLLVEDE